MRQVVAPPSVPHPGLRKIENLEQPAEADSDHNGDHRPLEDEPLSPDVGPAQPEAGDDGGALDLLAFLPHGRSPLRRRWLRDGSPQRWRWLEPAASLVRR